jgi:hypothetical protein
MQDLPAVPDPNDVADFEPVFELGGPAYRVMQRIGIVKGPGPDVGRRIVVFIVVTWIPMLVFCAVEGKAIGATPRSSLLLDFATYARFFVAVPLIFAAESIVGPRIHSAGLRFFQSNIVRQTDHPAYHAAAARAGRRRDALTPELLFLAAALFGSWFLTIEQLGGSGNDNWHTVWANGRLHLSPAGFWYHFVAVPLVQFFMLRWLWRLAIWTLFLWDMSRLRLNLQATHTDYAAGLGFLGAAHVTLAIFPFALSCVLAGELAFHIMFEGMDVPTLRGMGPLLAAYLLFVELATFGPLLILVPTLARAKRDGLRRYGMLVQQHNQLFHDKWIDNPGGNDETPLGNPDMSSLVDLGSGFLVVRQMSIFPVSRAQLIEVAVVACLPGLPLAILVLPIAEVLKLLLGVIT